MAYRYWCGECGYRTPWLGESRAQELQIEHYAKRHPDVAPGGSVEKNRKKPGEGPGCLTTLGLVILFLLLAVSCHH